jgi:hypothetical protein
VCALKRQFFTAHVASIDPVDKISTLLRRTQVRIKGWIYMLVRRCRAWADPWLMQNKIKSGSMMQEKLRETYFMEYIKSEKALRPRHLVM